MKVTILQLNKSLLLLLLISFARPGHAQIAGPTFDSLRTARERSLFVKNEILHLVGMGRVTAVRSRKSCNCGCNIIKESFRQKGGEIISMFLTFVIAMSSNILRWKKVGRIDSMS
ncbi:MAG: hypothetical protein HWD63_05095 [Candidatus Parvibacillus calidus]|nr:MAG: hypothetical protein HWD63_05095 [Candidatus Parvibacillus calidus]